MLLRNDLTSLFLATAVVAASAQSSNWVVYQDGDAPGKCIVPDGEMVDDSCCLDGPPPFFIRSLFSSTCFVILGLLEDTGLGLQSYLNCDDGTPVYGEACYNNGENGGIIPVGTVVNPTNLTSIEECGCTFQVSGNGCHKIRDFSSLPGFETDPRQVFLFMNETCEDDDGPSGPEKPTDESPTSSPTAAPDIDGPEKPTDEGTHFHFGGYY